VALGFYLPFPKGLKLAFKKVPLIKRLGGRGLKKGFWLFSPKNFWEGPGNLFSQREGKFSLI